MDSVREPIYGWRCDNESHPKPIVRGGLYRLKALNAADAHAHRYPGHMVFHTENGKATLDTSYIRPKDEEELW